MGTIQYKCPDYGVTVSSVLMANARLSIDFALHRSTESVHLQSQPRLLSLPLTSIDTSPFSDC